VIAERFKRAVCADAADVLADLRLGGEAREDGFDGVEPAFWIAFERVAVIAFRRRGVAENGEPAKPRPWLRAANAAARWTFSWCFG